jgi:hypothetical protein
MRVRSIILALLLGCGLAAAADQSPKAPKPQKVDKHAFTKAKAQRYSKSARKGASHKSPKLGKRSTGRKFAKHKTAKFKKHKA